MKKNKLLAFLSLIIIVSFSMLLISLNINEMHECSGDNCSICFIVLNISVISFLALILSSISFITVLNFNFFLSIKITKLYIIKSIKIIENLSFIPYKSLVLLKDKIQYSM